MLSSLFTLFFPEKLQDLTISSIELPITQPVQLKQDHLRRQGVMHLDCLTAALAYASSRDMQKLIHQFKYNKKRALAAPLGKVLLDAAAHIPLSEDMVICPVPLHWSRRFSRGFNQAELLAREVSDYTTLPIAHCLKRVRPTGHQAWRTHDERRLAMVDAFAVRSTSSHILLIDDVATTMSTLDACAEALKRRGVSHVQALVIALG